ncbi:C2 domain protein [Quillaja saponaria]|uniref:C2 domain protein n=1 Tax=Quillaja saponaria TaxID=32244 RepID=A0AAD7KSW5_QUISA|nr:C2 domain protein [Quillaja saponaria]KAJ7945400.1 C2 domain protein [Quillaja saponaria]
MDASQPSFSFELRIIRAKNTEFKSIENLFVRVYFSAGNKKKIQLNTQKVSKFDPFWNESFAFDCFGTQDTMKNLKQESVVFELRRRNTTWGSQLLGRAEVPWKTVLESPNMELEEYWVTMVSTKNKPPKLQVSLKIQVPAVMDDLKNRLNRNDHSRHQKWDHECGCKDGHGCSTKDYDIFAIAAALEAF